MDKSNFNYEHLLAVWHNSVQCLLCGRRNIEYHHIKGRGRKHFRALHSSLFNCAPLCRDCHSWGAKNQYEIISYFIRKAFEKVNEATIKGSYEINKNDKAFLQHYHLAPNGK